MPINLLEFGVSGQFYVFSLVANEIKQGLKMCLFIQIKELFDLCLRFSWPFFSDFLLVYLLLDSE
jgi:hypothetical protein